MKKHLRISALLLATGIAATAFVAAPVQPEPVSVLPVQTELPPTAWKIDKSHSGVKFTVTHLLVSEVDGYFKNFDGVFEHTKEDFSDAKVEFTVDAASVTTNNERRDQHLQGADFFDTQKYPKITFVGKTFKSTGGKKYALTGDLTVKDVTKSVTFDVTHNGTNDTGRGIKSGFKAKTTIDRQDFKITGGGAAVGDDVEITVNLSLNKA